MYDQMLVLSLIGLGVMANGYMIYVIFKGWRDARKYKKECRKFVGHYED